MNGHDSLIFLSRSTRACLLACVGAGIVFLVLPSGACLLWSLQSGPYLDPTTPLSLGGETYGRLLNDTAWGRAFLSSLVLAVLVSTCSCALAIVLATLIWAGEGLGMRVLSGCATLAIAVPWALYSIGISQLVPEPLSPWIGVTFGQLCPIALVLTGFLAFTFGRADRMRLWAALALGHGWKAVILRVIVPARFRAIAVVWFLGLFLSIDDVFVVQAVGHSMIETLATKLWTSIRYDLSPVAAAAGTCLSLLTVTCILVGLLLYSIRNAKGKDYGPDTPQSN